MKWTNEEINFLIENYNKLGRKECANILNRSVDSVATKIRDSKLNLSSKEIWTDNELDFLFKNYTIKGVNYCMKELKMNNRRIINKANNLGLKTNIVIKSESNKKNKINYELFDFNFTKESVYILGLLWADGHVREDKKITTISCIETDIDEVLPIFMSTGKWLISKPILKKGKTQKKLHTTTWGLFNVLKKYNYLTKSNNCPLKMINIIPNELKKYWYRGFLDGDGCIRLGKKYGSDIIFTSNVNEKWDFIINLCDNLQIHYTINRKIIKNGGGSQIRISRKNDVKILGDYIYSEYDNIGFSRKYKKYLDMCNRFNNKKPLINIY